MTARRSVMGGAALIGAAVGFVAVFSWLAAHFGYPDVLDAPAEIVLPRLLGLGAVGRAVWLLYAMLPLLLIPAALGAARVWGAQNRARARLLIGTGVTAAVCMLIGLVRWPTLQWALAEAWPSATADAHGTMTNTFDALNLILGNVIGEFSGELALNGFFLAAAWGLAANRAHRVWVYAGAVVGAVGLVGALRNVALWAQPFSAVDNALLPLWLIVLGVLLVRGTTQRGE